MSKDFFKFTPQHLGVARNLKINELKLWLYLSLLDPFGDRSIDLPPLEEIEEKTGLKKSAYYKARTKLENLGLWNFTEKKTIANNLFARLFLKNKTPESVKVNSIPKNSENSLINQDSIPKNSENSLINQDSIPEKWENSLINQDSIPEKWENQPLKTNQSKDFSLSQTIQTISDYSDLSDQLKYDKNIDERKEEGLIDDKCLVNVVEMNENEIDDRIEKLTDNQLIKEEVKKQDTTPCYEDERLKNEEFIRYAQGKLPKARDIKRYLLTKDKTTGDRILERLWLEYQQWKTGKTNNPNSTGNEYFDNLIEEYRKIKPWEGKFNWEKVDWTKLACFDLWLNKARNCKADHTFIEDNSLGFNRNLRTIFFRWFEQNKQQTTANSHEIPENPEGIGLINAFKQMMGGGINYAH